MIAWATYIVIAITLWIIFGFKVAIFAIVISALIALFSVDKPEEMN